MHIEVIDSSHDDASVDFNAAARAGIVGVIHKATEGVGDVLYGSTRGISKMGITVAPSGIV